MEYFLPGLIIVDFADFGDFRENNSVWNTVYLLFLKLNPREITNIVKKRTKTKEFGQNCTYTAKLNPREILKKSSSAKLKLREKSKIGRPQKLIRAKINPLKVSGG